ncbi:Phox homologous domain-containing protein [Apiospora kogelbergensis]|uniref:Endosomal/vacuolar adapter protein YPT35 n=1 Tax=Apiospora kogelbergensis TaxID=1337665 RepID=A0AAW0RCA4_9PEZI
MATSVGLRTASTLSLSLRKNAPPTMTMAPVETPPSPPATETDSEPESPGVVDTAPSGPSTTTAITHDESDDNDNDVALRSPFAPRQQHLENINENDDDEHEHHHDGGEDSDDDVFVDSSSTRSAASPMISPVTSPPYWLMQSGGGGGGFSSGGGFESGSHGYRPINRHQRGASVDSIPLGGITLQDNENDDLLDDRNRGCWAQSVEVSDYVVVNGSATNIGAFVVWNIRVQTLNGSYMNIRKRYSEFDDLRCRLMRTFPNFEAAVPELPPKSLISKFRPRFLEKRRAGLQYFLHCIMLNPEFSGSPVLKEFLFS